MFSLFEFLSITANQNDKVVIKQKIDDKGKTTTLLDKVPIKQVLQTADSSFLSRKVAVVDYKAFAISGHYELTIV